MEKTRRMEAIPEQLSYAAVPRPLLKRFIIVRSIRCAIYVVFAGLMLLPLSVLPGLVLFVLPGEVVLVSRIRDETELIQWVKNNRVEQSSNWEDAELEAEMTRLKTNEKPSTLQGYSR